MPRRPIHALAVAVPILACLAAAPRNELFAQASPSPAPVGWHIGSDTPDRFEFTYDRRVIHGGAASGTLTARPGSAEPLIAGVNQAVRAERYRGQRVRIAGYVRTREVGSVMLWARVEGLESDSLVSFALSNTAARPITGTTGWQRLEAIVEVPAAAEAIVFGVLQQGGGQMWLDDFELNIVIDAAGEAGRLPTPMPSREAPEDQRRIRGGWATLPDRPVGLDFEPVRR